MKDVEIVVFKDKAWVRLTEYQKLKDRYEALEETNEYQNDAVCRLQKQIEKMENCANCDHWFDMDSTCELHKEEIPVFMIDCGCKDWECAYKEVEE